MKSASFSPAEALPPEERAKSLRRDARHDRDDQPAVLKPPRRGSPLRYRARSEARLDQIHQLHALPPGQRFAMRVVATVLPFRVNDYVIDELIDWDDVPDDPIFQLTFPQRAMLGDEHFGRIASLLTRSAPHEEVQAAADAIRRELNPHPAGQKQLNVPAMDGARLEGMQHKYTETVLFFPKQGQTCHAFCTFCFRWAQFIGVRDLRFAAKDAANLVAYLTQQRDVTDVLITGGDPMVMRARNLAGYLDALLAPELSHVRNIRIGSKSLTFWPHRFLSDEDADDILRAFERVVAAGKHLTFMAHFNHWRELEPEPCRRAIARIRSTGAVVRTQGPLLRHINDDADVWARMWRDQVSLGCVPYYMFVERNTGARRYFEVPLVDTHRIYADAVRQVSGLARTVRGPSMSAGPGKIEILGPSRVAGEEIIALRFLQAREAEWVGKPFYARLDPHATWLDHLRPAFGEPTFFFEEEYRRRWGTHHLR